MAIVPVGAQTIAVTGTVQAPIAVKEIILCRANSHHHIGEEARGTGISMEQEQGCREWKECKEVTE